MAKKEKAKSNSTEELIEDKVEKISFRQLLKDERTHKILGSLLLFISLTLFVSFTSYLFTWDEDQDKVLQAGSRMFWGTDQEVSNLLGTLGAFVSHLFIYKGFGIASYLFCSLFFVVGVNLLFGRKVFSIARNIRYIIVGVPLISTAASLFLGAMAFPWGGASGDLYKDWLLHVTGPVGAYGLVIVAFFSYIIWRFNPSFKSLKNKAVKDQEAAMEKDEVMLPLEDVQEPEPEKKKVEKKKNEEVKQAEPILLIEKDPEPEVELLPEPVVEKKKPEIKPIVPIVDNTGLELEIKSADEQQIPEIKTPESVKSKAYDPILDLRDYKFPTLDLLENHGSEKIVQDPQELENNKIQIINTLKNYDISIQKISATVGPTVTLYEIIPAAGVRISRIKNLEDDIALSLAALGIRIIAPIPGKGTIGIEVPNAKKTIVSMKTLLSAEKFTKNNFSLPIAIGKKIDNENFIVDLASMPHLLMAGATGQGKSVGLNAILVSLLYSKHPSQLKFVLVDPKKVELSIYKSIEKHFLAKLPGEEDAIITDTKKVVHTLNALCIEMDNRYDQLKEAGCRNIREYNEKFARRVLNPEKGHQFLPFIVLVVDEFADLIMTAGKEVEMPIARLAQLARAVGIHLIIATQRPSVNIITGTIKANFPARIAFKVSSKVDSRTILDAGGADQLIGKGDMLVNYNGEVVRLQCAFVDTPEVDKIVDFISAQRGYPQAFLLPEYIDEKDNEGRDFDVNDKDPLFEDAARLIVSSQTGSTSLLQRRMKLGYNRAGRLMDQLEAAGVVGASQGSKVRDVLIKTDAELQELLNGMM
jgi:S-DNA-T family DNA segregation ATPase FtsK/SpoIIIE